MALSELDPKLQGYFEQGLAASTQKTYKSALGQFHEFCVRYHVYTPFPLTEKLLCYFAVHLAERKLAPQTIKTYLAAARNMHISLGFPDPRDHSSMPLLQRVQMGIRRVHASKQTRPARVRLPITPAILDQLRSHWQASKHPDRLGLWAVSTLCFAGFFRLGELLPASDTLPSGLPTGVQWGDVTVDDACSPTMLKTHLRVSKCDQFGKGVDVYVGRTDSPRCPVIAVVAYMAARGRNPGSFFLTHQGRPLTKPRFVAEVRSGLTKAGLDQTTFAGHSFRIGAATAAAQAGVPDSAIQMLGRWNSTAFLAYIRTPRQQLASFTGSIM